ncbi:glycerol-3-phosphate dehydrogenase [Shimia biformata]|uniref:glycerol-3-phosphate dehydrogenase n=1 Tax=Shimia biformata TaxID=1294299 RepID=UPI00194E39DD|nr:glycerol-3-phosphate dehydrogenase [Shimia biformata]
MAGQPEIFDILVIGGGVNGTGVARDAAGRGLSVALVEKSDLASGTSSGSTKLFHGGLRYLEYFKLRLVRESLIEREVLLTAMPHIAWPMRFVLPLDPEMRFDGDTPASRLLGMVMPWAKGRRPAWLIRLGLLFYDHLGGRKILPETKALDLSTAAEGRGLRPGLRRAFEYSDVWVDDARLVMLNARDAQARGATVLTRTEAVSATRGDRDWAVVLRDRTTGVEQTVRARVVVNAAGPWVEQVLRRVVKRNAGPGVRLVRGSHIVTRRLFDHDKAYFFQGSDGRIVFAIPYEQDFTLIGTTDVAHDAPDLAPRITEEERDYLIAFVNRYLDTPITADDIVWTYSGVRPLYDDGASSATAATRDYVLDLDTDGAPLLSVFGGKITTYRRLAEAALDRLGKSFPGATTPWTQGVPLPGGDFPVFGVSDLQQGLIADYPFLTPDWAARLVRLYGTEARSWLGAAQSAADLGRDFGATLTEAELVWMRDHEFARSAEDALWRRSKLGLRLNADQIDGVRDWFDA